MGIVRYVSNDGFGIHWFPDMSRSAYPEDNYRDLAHSDDVYGTLDLTERDTCL